MPMSCDPSHNVTTNIHVLLCYTVQLVLCVFKKKGMEKAKLGGLCPPSMRSVSQVAMHAVVLTVTVLFLNSLHQEFAYSLHNIVIDYMVMLLMVEGQFYHLSIGSLAAISYLSSLWKPGEVCFDTRVTLAEWSLAHSCLGWR